MSKRKRFIVSSVLLSLGFVGIQFLGYAYRYLSIVILSVLTLILFYWSLREGLKKNFTLLALLLPFLFTLGVGLFWFLLPSGIFARIPIILFYAAGIYVLCLTSNIFTVSAIRTIALLRAARGVGFVLTLVTTFLLFDTVVSLKASLLVLLLLVFVISYCIFLQGLWSITLEGKLNRFILIDSFVFSLILVEISAMLFFWPVTVTVGSLFLTVAVYVLLGLGQARLEGRLFKETVREYLLVGLLVFIGIFVATRWRV